MTRSIETAAPGIGAADEPRPSDPAVIGLVEALEEFSREYDGFQDGDGNPCPTLDRARAALAKYATQQHAGEVGDLVSRDMVTAALKERFGADRYARDYQYLDANFRDDMHRVLSAALGEYATQQGTGGGEAFVDVEAQAEAWSDRVEIQDMVASVTRIFEERTSPPLMSRFRQQVMAVIQQAFIEGATQQPPLSTETKGEGDWIEWAGGENPVPGKRVDYQMRGAGDEDDVFSDALRWSHDEQATDIIAYRVVTPIEGNGDA